MPAQPARAPIVAQASGLHAQVVREVGREIVGGLRAPGEILPPAEILAAQLGVSRTVVREAVRVLAAKGLVESRQRVGTRVLPRTEWNLFDPDVLRWQHEHAPNSEFLEQVAEVRLVIEPAAARMAADRARDDELALICAALDRMRAAADAGNVQLFVAADAEFHTAVLTACGNPLLARFGEIVRSGLTGSLRATNRTLADIRRSLPVHEHVGSAIIGRDPAQAHQVMWDLVYGATQDLHRRRRRT